MAKQASDNGWPMLRHLSIHFPQDRECLKQDFEFMLGDRMLSCPVIEDQLDVKRNDITQANYTWKVYLPEGKWYHYWTDKCYQGAAAYEVPAAPGSLPFFIREGKILPTFNREVDTFVEGVEQADIKALQKRFIKSSFTDLKWSTPTGERFYIEQIERFFLHRQPGAKSNMFNIKIKNSNITNTTLREIIEKNIIASLNKIVPVHTQLNNIIWE